MLALSRIDAARFPCRRSKRFRYGPSCFCSARCKRVGQPRKAASVEGFYKGKTISLVISVSVGGGSDLYARVFAKHLKDQYPGHPTIVPQNMPGAGGVNAMDYLASVAPRDGTVIGTFARGLPLYPLLFKANYDGSKLGYIGSITTDTSVCITWHEPPKSKPGRTS